MSHPKRADPQSPTPSQCELFTCKQAKPKASKSQFRKSYPRQSQEVDSAQLPRSPAHSSFERTVVSATPVPSKFKLLASSLSAGRDASCPWVSSESSTHKNRGIHRVQVCD